MPEDTISADLAQMIGGYLAASAEFNQKIVTDLMIAYKADYDCLVDNLRVALRTIPSGGTTAQYERGLSMIESALYPSPQTVEPYRRAAERWAAGESEGSTYSRLDNLPERW